MLISAAAHQGKLSFGILSGVGGRLNANLHYQPYDSRIIHDDIIGRYILYDGV